MGRRGGSARWPCHRWQKETGMREGAADPHGRTGAERRKHCSFNYTWARCSQKTAKSAHPGPQGHRAAPQRVGQGFAPTDSILEGSTHRLHQEVMPQHKTPSSKEPTCYSALLAFFLSPDFIARCLLPSPLPLQER